MYFEMKIRVETITHTAMYMTGAEINMTCNEIIWLALKWITHFKMTITHMNINTRYIEIKISHVETNMTYVQMNMRLTEMSSKCVNDYDLH